MDRIEKAPKKVLVDIVKLAQKRGMEGSNGGWKDFLRVFDKKFGSSVSDPSKRPPEALIAFLKTFNNADDIKFFVNVVERHDSIEHLEKKPDNMSREQELVYKTISHPLYARHYSFPSHEEGWVFTKTRKKNKESRCNTMVAVDCEMVECEDGTDALVRVCVVDRDLKVQLDKLVKPDKPVADYRTHITGVAAKDLEQVTCSLEDVQQSMKKLLARGMILVGHSLNNDLLALKVDHPRVIDTSLLFKYSTGSDKYSTGSSFRRPSLSDLCKSVLGYELRKEGAPHDCLEDACAAMKLVVAKIKGAVDDVIPTKHAEFREINATKLLCHRIPNNIPGEKLSEIIPGNFTVEIKAHKKGKEMYTAFAVFKNKREADEAYEALHGDQVNDTMGRPQKLVYFQLDSGESGRLFVRKVAEDGEVASNKRASTDEIPIHSKKLKTDEAPESIETTECDQCLKEIEIRGYLKEIESLKKKLSERDQEISGLHKIIVAQARKNFGF